MPTVTVNGEPREVPAGATVLDLLADLGRHPRTVAVEHRGEILPRDRYAATTLREGDRLEVVGFVQGGAGNEPPGRPVVHPCRPQPRPVYFPFAVGR